MHHIWQFSAISNTQKREVKYISFQLETDSLQYQKIH